MKTKKIITKIMLALCLVSIIALIVVVLTGCTFAEKKSLSNYVIDINFNDEEKTLSCNEILTYENKTETVLNFICLNLYPNAFREESTSSPVSLANQHKAYPNGLSYGEININSVSVLHNTAKYCNSFNITQPTYSEIANFFVENKLEENEYFIGGEDENILYIIFKTPLYPGEKTEIEIEFDVVLPNVNHRFGYGNNTVNLANFYPIVCVFNEGDFDKSLYHYNGDPFFSDMSNYSVSLTAPKEYVVSNTGVVASQTQNEGFQKVFMEAKNVRDFAIVLSKEFKVLSKVVEETEVKYYYFSDPNPEKSLETSVKALLFFNNLIGEYSYPTLSVVEANFVHGGMEFPNLVYISNEIGDEKTYNQVIVHEIAHQWWYNMVGNSAFKFGWLDEGLTEYSTALFFEANPQYSLSKDTIINNAYSSYSLFVQVYGNVFGEVDTSMNRPLDKYETEQEYVYTAYIKGMLFFDSLREIVGKEKFEKCLKNYFKEYKFQNVTPDKMIASFEKTLGTSLESYFNAWINGDLILLK